jgi:amino acid transporter
LRRSLSLFDVTCLGVNAIIGSGIFSLPDDLYREMGGLSPLAFILCALGLLPVALCYAEAASRTDKSGGPYVYAREAFGPWTGFVVGWLCYANTIFSFAAVASVASAYLGRFVPAVTGVAIGRVVGAGLIAAFGALNYLGTKPSARVTDLFTVSKLGVLFLLVAAAGAYMCLI